MYHYIDADTKIYKFPSLTKLDDPKFIEVPLAPPSGLSRWNNGEWVELSPQEIQENFPQEEPYQSEQVSAPPITTASEIVIWGDDQGEALSTSGLFFIKNNLLVPGNINIEGNYFINDKPISTSKDKQIVIETEEERYSATSWSTIPQMELVTKNTEIASYTISAELLLKTSRSNRDFEVAMFVNGEQLLKETLSIDFNRGSDDKPINWSSDDYQLKPGSVVTLGWRRVGSSVTCYVGRRKLEICQNL